MKAIDPTIQETPEFSDITDFRKVMAELEVAETRVTSLPHLWTWDYIRAALTDSASFDLEKIHRRAYALCNPGLDGRPTVGNTLFASVSIYHPGDRAPVHRHSASASRFALEGSGGYTNVAGERLEMTRGDLVITPNGEWHDHGNDGDEPMIWVDVLDVPLVENMNAIFTEWDYKEAPDGSNSDQPIVKKQQSVTRRKDYSQTLFAESGIVPRFGGKHRFGRRFSPKFLYRGAEVRRAQNLLRDEEGDPWEGILMEYTDPTTGESVVPTLSFRSQLLRPGETTLPKRESASTVYCVLEGEGETEINGETFRWSRNDILYAPSWMWRQHRNLSSDKDAVLYAVTDAPALEKLALYRAEGRDKAGDRVDLRRWPDFD